LIHTSDGKKLFPDGTAVHAPGSNDLVQKVIAEGKKIEEMNK